MILSYVALVITLIGFTLHALWPLIFIWAVMKPKPLPIRIEGGGMAELELPKRVALLEEEVSRLSHAMRPHDLETKP